MKIKKPFIIIGIISISVIAFAAVLLTVTSSIMNHTAYLESYDVSGEKIPAVYSVLGKRNVSGVSTGSRNGVHYQKYTYYGMDSAVDDVENYISYLSDEQGFILYDDFDKQFLEGEIRMGKRAASGKEILITISYSVGTFTIFIQNT